MFQKILVVCLGNICRSPVGEGFLKEYFFKTGQNHRQVTSAGIAAVVDAPASPHSITVMKNRGIDISSHVARQLTHEMMIEHDLVLVMELDQKKFLEQRFPFSRGKVQVLGRFQNRDIEDPYLKPIEAFEVMTTQVDNYLKDWIKHCWAEKNEAKAKIE